MSAISIYINCAGCGKNLSASYSSCDWIICPGCGTSNRKSSNESKAGVLAGEDLSLLRSGTNGSWQDAKFVVTGRIRYRFNDDSYLNWWHLESAGRSYGWLADSYGKMYLALRMNLELSLATIGAAKPGKMIKIHDREYTMCSFAQTSGWEAEGELPDLPSDKPFIWVELAGISQPEEGFDIQIEDRQTLTAYRTLSTDPEALCLTNIRTTDGWAG